MLTGKEGSAARIVFAVLFFTAANLLFTQEWVLAGQLFQTKGVAEAYAGFDSVLPKLVLRKISSFPARFVDDGERFEKKLYDASEKRLTLIKERAALIKERDILLLTPIDRLARERKQKEINIKIRQKEREILTAGDIPVVSSEISSDEAVPLSLWKNGNELYVPKADKPLEMSMREDSVSALLTGTIEDIAGYMYVEMTLYPLYSSEGTVTVYEAGLYEDIDRIATRLAYRLAPDLSRSTPARVSIVADPIESRVFLDGSLITDSLSDIAILPGMHVITVQAEGKKNAQKSFEVKAGKKYAIEITLESEQYYDISFAPSIVNASTYIEGVYAGEEPLTVRIPFRPLLGERVAENNSTFFLLSPGAQSDTVYEVRDTKENLEEIINRRRESFYWSLGFFYMSLPFSMLSYGITKNTYDAFNENRIPQTRETAEEIRAWSAFSDISRIVSIGLSLNLAYNLVRYLRAANEAVPQTAKAIRE